MLNLVLKYAIGIGSIVGIFLTPLLVDASTLSPATGSNGSVVTSFTGGDNHVTWFASNGSYLGQSSSAGSVSLGSLSVGTVVNFVFYNTNNTQHGSYCGEATVNSNTTYANCTSNGNDVTFTWQGTTVSYTFISSAPPTLALFTVASSTPLIASAFATFSRYGLDILATTIFILAALLVFYWGWRKVKFFGKM